MRNIFTEQASFWVFKEIVKCLLALFYGIQNIFDDI